MLLRLFFAAIVTYLLQIPLLQAVGGALLLWIAWKLVHDSPGNEESKVQAGGNIWEAVRIIIIADIVMSLTTLSPWSASPEATCGSSCSASRSRYR